MWGKEKISTEGKKYTVDASYIRSEIRSPSKITTKGYPENIMISYSREQLSDEGIEKIIAYIKSLK